MAACIRLSSVLKTAAQGCRCHHPCLTNIRHLSFLATQQRNTKPLMDHSQLTRLVRTSHNRQEMTFSKKRRKFKPRHEEDGVSTDMTVIYENNMNRLNFWGQLTINALAIPIYGMSIKIIASGLPLQDLSITSGPLTAVAYIVMYGGLLLGVNDLCRRSVRRMYTDEDTGNFAAVVQDWKMMKRTIHFDLSSVQRKPPGNISGSFFGNLKIQGRSYLVSPADFVQPRFYNLLMGYDVQRSVDLDIIRDIDVKDVIRNKAKQLKKPPKVGG